MGITYPASFLLDDCRVSDELGVAAVGFLFSTSLSM